MPEDIRNQIVVDECIETVSIVKIANKVEANERENINKPSKCAPCIRAAFLLSSACILLANNFCVLLYAILQLVALASTLHSTHTLAMRCSSAVCAYFLPSLFR